VTEALDEEHLAVAGQGARDPDRDADGDHEIEQIGNFDHCSFLSLLHKIL
jgi:hypothetical protein